MSCPPQSSWLDHPNDICWGVQSIKLFVMQSSPLPCYLKCRFCENSRTVQSGEKRNVHFGGAFRRQQTNFVTRYELCEAEKL
jgi:hypothetical protein